MIGTLNKGAEGRPNVGEVPEERLLEIGTEWGSPVPVLLQSLVVIRGPFSINHGAGTTWTAWTITVKEGNCVKTSSGIGDNESCA